MENKLLEKISELVHDIWVDWSRELSVSEHLSSKRLRRWGKCWVPYKELSPELKNLDRDIAKRFLDIIELEISNGLSEEERYNFCYNHCLARSHDKVCLMMELNMPEKCKHYKGLKK